jgi:tRNA(Arg) A34 adenosine deaminase TadA
MNREIFYILLCAVLLPLLVIVLTQKISWFRRRIELDGVHLERLKALAKRSLDSMDVPVGALLLYDDEIIGEGYNTVLRYHSAGGHAEINAISSALASLGYDYFSALDRDKLVLLSTFEPCLMCIGACVNYNIRTVYYLEGKDAAYLLGEGKSYARYLFRRTRIRNRGEQAALFKLHPRYPKRAIK